VQNTFVRNETVYLLLILDEVTGETTRATASSHFGFITTRRCVFSFCLLIHKLLTGVHFAQSYFCKVAPPARKRSPPTVASEKLLV
jgi:hypothetical protein